MYIRFENPEFIDCDNLTNHFKGDLISAENFNELHENWNDYGLDQCEDEYENGIGGCCYNSTDCLNIENCQYKTK